MDHNFKNNKRFKLTTAEFITIISPFLLLLYYKLSSTFELKSLCLWKMLTGHECYGCGMTHAVVALLKGNLHAAINYNPLVIIVFPLLLYIWGKYTMNCLKK